MHRHAQAAGVCVWSLKSEDRYHSWIYDENLKRVSCHLNLLNEAFTNSGFPVAIKVIFCMFIDKIQRLN